MRGKTTRITASQSYEHTLAQQGYHIIGTTGAVKTCLWLKKSLRDEGVCYKEQFYGISCHRCIQMTPTVHCNQRCLHCWRATDLDTSDARHVDEPQGLVDASLGAQRRLISGFKGFSKVNTVKFKEAQEPNQVALSLSGEPTLYPYLDELIALYKQQGMTTFVVSNGSTPGMLERIRPTQVYLSLNSANEELYYQICRPRTHGFNQLLESLHVLSDHPSRTAIRITLARNMNAAEPTSYARLMEHAEPDYIEVKSYMHLGYSRRRLPRAAMLTFEEVEAFALQIAVRLGYALVGSSHASRVIVLSKEGALKKVVSEPSHATRY